MSEAKPYGIVEQEVLFMPGLSMRAKVLYCILKTYSSNGDPSFPKQEIISSSSGMSESTIIRATKDLVKAGIIEKGRNWKLNNYTILSDVKLTPDNNKADSSSIKLTPDSSVKSTPDNRTIPSRTIPKRKKKERKLPNPLHAPCKKIFLKFHNENFTFKYIWNYTKDGPNLNTLIKNLQTHIEQAGGGGEFEDNFLHFLNIAIKDNWISEHFTVSILMGQTTNILNKHKGKQSRYDPAEHEALLAEIEEKMKL